VQLLKLVRWLLLLVWWCEPVHSWRRLIILLVMLVLRQVMAHSRRWRVRQRLLIHRVKRKRPITTPTTTINRKVLIFAAEDALSPARPVDVVALPAEPVIGIGRLNWSSCLCGQQCQGSCCRRRHDGVNFLWCSAFCTQFGLNKCQFLCVAFGA
jgi:hypothetical protein